MDLNEIKEIIEIMKRSGLTEFEIEEKGLRLRICRSPNGNGNLAVVQAAPTYPGSIPPILSHQPGPSSPSSESKAEEAEEENFHLIKSPMVGTFTVHLRQKARPSSMKEIRLSTRRRFVSWRQ